MGDLGQQLSCGSCSKTFHFTVLLNDHVRRCHLNKDNFKCYHCPYSTNQKWKLAVHMKTHFSVKRTQKVQYTCKLCTSNAFQCQERQGMLRHYSEKHGVPVEPRKLVFNTNDEFKKWISKVQTDEHCSFVPAAGAHRTKNKVLTYLRCFRDGFYNRRGKGKRHLKSKKSSKIEGICPASISESEDVDTGVVSVKFIRTHVGHETEIGRLRLTRPEKKEISVKIAAGVPFNVILDGVRDSMSVEDKSGISRVNLLTRKDLWNISSSYNLNSVAVRHESDSVSLAAWVIEMQNNSNIVRFYKPQNSRSPDYEDLHENDFILIIANDTQLEMLKKHGPKVVCFDSTHGFNQYGFDLTTILVLNEASQGFPCGYLVSNRSDAEIIKIFVETLKNAMNFSFQPEVMMTDMAENFFNGWCQVMPAPVHRLFCCWHVDHAWRKNLKRINDSEKKKQVYKDIRTVLEHLDKKTFATLLNNTITKLLSDPETSKFGEYFKAEYSNNFQSWAFCFRQHCGINCNMHLESMHKTIKHLYLKGKKVKRLDKGLHALMRFTRDKLYDILLSAMRGKLTPKIAEIRKRHKASLALLDFPIAATEDGWSILSQEGHEVYNITKNDTDCSCEVICEDCRICIHTFKCSCPDSAIKTNICKHIHRVSAFLQSEESSPTTDVPENQDLDDFEEDLEDLVLHEVESSLPVSLLDDLNSTPAPSHADLEKKKQTLQQEFSSILDAVTCDAHYDIVTQALRPVLPTIQATNEGLRFAAAKVSKVNSCANISPQKNFISTKKRREKKNDGGLRKPTAMERTLNVASLLLTKNSLDD